MPGRLRWELSPTRLSKNYCSDRKVDNQSCVHKRNLVFRPNVRVLRAFLVALFTAVAGCVLAFFVGDYLTRLAHVPEMEGQRGMTVVFLCAPLGILAGLVVGIVSSILVRRRGAAGFFIAQGWALLVACIIASLSVGVPYLFSDKPPRIGGKELSLEFEVRVPPQFSIADPVNDNNLRVILYSGNRETTAASIDWAAIKRSPDGAIIPGHVELLAHNPARSFLVAVGNDLMAGQYIDLKLPPSPGLEDEQWSGWIPAAQRANLGTISDAERFSVRYRVQRIER
jgi:hypothetical protein